MPMVFGASAFLSSPHPVKAADTMAATAAVFIQREICIFVPSETFENESAPPSDNTVFLIMLRKIPSYPRQIT